MGVLEADSSLDVEGRLSEHVCLHSLRGALKRRGRFSQQLALWLSHRRCREEAAPPNPTPGREREGDPQPRLQKPCRSAKQRDSEFEEQAKGGRERKGKQDEENARGGEEGERRENSTGD